MKKVFKMILYFYYIIIRKEIKKKMKEFNNQKMKIKNNKDNHK